MPEHKALLLLEKQGELAVRDVPTYSPGAGQLKIKIISTALNPVDWKMATTGFFIQDYPFILGTDAAGEVVELGEGVTGFAQGDKV